MAVLVTLGDSRQPEITTEHLMNAFWLKRLATVGRLVQSLNALTPELLLEKAKLRSCTLSKRTMEYSHFDDDLSPRSFATLKWH